jgi:hypothetical protein
MAHGLRGKPARIAAKKRPPGGPPRSMATVAPGGRTKVVGDSPESAAAAAMTAAMPPTASPAPGPRPGARDGMGEGSGGLAIHPSAGPAKIGGYEPQHTSKHR